MKTLIALCVGISGIAIGIMMAKAHPALGVHIGFWAGVILVWIARE